MKKLFYLMMVAAVLVATSCKKDDDDDNGGVTPPTEQELVGEMTEDLTLDASIDYKLIGPLVMLEGTTLTIPAGTVIEATDVTTDNPNVRYIAIARGAQIFIEGSADNPVVMTSATKEAESWGGLVICGAAPQNKAGIEGGESTSEVGDLPYGGSDVNDNSGSIEYLIVEYTGYKYTNEKEFNGVSFFGVGAGTTVDYVTSYMGGDDGLEFFGGTVNPTHLVSVGSGDDGIDFADGFSGMGEFWYVLNSAKSGIEGSNNGDNGASDVPMTNATLKNFTIYNMGEKPWYLKEGAGMQNIDNVVMGGLSNPEKAPYFFADLDDVPAVERIENGDIVVDNVKFYNIGNVAKAVEGLTINENPNATGAGNGVERPSWVSGAMNTSSDGATIIPDAVGGGQVVDLPIGEQTEDLTLEVNTLYKLNGALVMTEGTTLTIPAGTIIEATDVTTENPDVRYIAVARGAQIFVEGTETSPVVMTSTTKEAESWGGLVICGAAPQNKAGSAGGESTSEVGDLPYGGTAVDDNSGSIKYLRVEYTGYKYTNEKEFNGVSFFGVGAGTVVDYVVSYMGGDDGLEFFGGTVNPTHLVSVGSGDDGIDFADGFSGTGEFWYVYNSAKSGIEGSNNGDNGASDVPMTNATLRNLTVYAMGEKPWYLKEGAGMQDMDNVFIGGLADNKQQAYFFADLDDVPAMERIANEDIVVNNVAFVNMGVNNTVKAVEGLSFTENPSATGAGNGANKPAWVSTALNTLSDGTKVIPDDIVTQEIIDLPTGEQTSDLTLEFGPLYKLNGALVMTEGTKLTIDPGVVIEATQVTTSNPDVRYIAIARGAMIDAEGTAEAPIVMTAVNREAEEWGGLVICGAAPQNKAGVAGGESTSEVGDLPYGGSNVNDNSGTLKYVRVEYTGYKYTNEKEFNGVSFFGVGAGTTVEYVSSYMGGDDGLEFFGGSVNPSYLVSVGSGDDGIDFADGFSGTGMNWYVKDAAKSSIEGSNNGDNGASNVPMTNATLSNLTLMGCGEKPWYLKEGAGMQAIDNVVIGGLTNPDKAPYFFADLDDAPAMERIANGDITVTNVLFYEIGDVEKAVEGLTVNENANATGAGNVTEKPDWASGWALPSKK